MLKAFVSKIELCLDTLQEANDVLFGGQSCHKTAASLYIGE
jgi:hypothetical protein